MSTQQAENSPEPIDIQLTKASRSMRGQVPNTLVQGFLQSTACRRLMISVFCCWKAIHRQSSQLFLGPPIKFAVAGYMLIVPWRSTLTFGARRCPASIWIAPLSQHIGRIQIRKIRWRNSGRESEVEQILMGVDKEQFLQAGLTGRGSRNLVLGCFSLAITDAACDQASQPLILSLHHSLPYIPLCKSDRSAKPGK